MIPIFLETGFTSLVESGLNLLISLLAGWFIYFIYRKVIQGVAYSQKFASLLMCFTLMTTMVTRVSSNEIFIMMVLICLVLASLRGIKRNVLNTFYIGWSLGTGMLIGKNEWYTVLIGGVCISLVMILFVLQKGMEKSYLLLIQTKNDPIETHIEQILKGSTSAYVLKSKSLQQVNHELIFAIRLKGTNTTFLNQLNALKEIDSVVMKEAT
ncbi:hypothetical protein ACWOFR_03980 [Carnobacterium gallinarum]|uniref:hypothetical protein n=1 Tax=Carnobacterium gallinarum TaxID=2749 RepID=UPI00054D3C22|nr:hypothetical protein [Carnobacterium gallinarum]